MSFRIIEFNIGENYVLILSFEGNFMYFFIIEFLEYNFMKFEEILRREKIGNMKKIYLYFRMIYYLR